MAYILIVDDDESIRSTMARALSHGGHDVTEAESGLDALNVVGTHPFAVAFVDLYMPHMDGLELIPKLLIQSPSTKIVAMSGGLYGGKGVDLLRAAERAGAARSVTKPFTLDDVLAIVAELAGGTTEPDVP